MDNPTRTILPQIKSPLDLKNLSVSQLELLAGEIRQCLISTVSRNGGHLAPNLGVVELTIALHTVFESPRDQIVWDVGHQSYVHKLLTGRYERFDTLRQHQGLSGFPKPVESEHDIFAAGHSSTSISAAIGLAKARDLLGEDHHVVAVIGDGSMTGGMAFEAMNHLGHLQTDMMIILNDNEMSISKNVGALSRYLTRIRLNPNIRRFKTDLKTFIRKIPHVGQATVRSLERMKGSLASLIIPGMLFEDLGISYIGPIDGHDLNELMTTLKSAGERKGPVLVHVLTTKGKGFQLAEKNPQRFHGTGPFETSSGKKLDSSDSLSYTDVFSATIVDMATRYPQVVAITAAMADGTGLVEFSKRFPERFFDVGIAEEHAVTMAAGLARRGFRPVVAIYSTFLQRAYDQIIHDVCLQNLPVLLMLDRAGLVGPDGPTHHGVFDLSYLRHIPNLTVMAPRNEVEFHNMIYTALHHNGPVAIRYPKRDGLKPVNLPYHPLPIGKGELLLSGQHVALLAVGAMVPTALEAARELEKAGINCTVADARFIKPLDEELILNLVGTHRQLITIEENVIAGGYGSGVAEFLSNAGIKGVDLKILGVPNQFVTHGSAEILFQECGLDSKGICRTVHEVTLPTVGLRARR